MTNKFEEIWNEAREQAGLSFSRPGTLSWELALYRELKEKIEPLIQQQALPVVPEFVADEIKRLKQEYGSLRDLYSGNVVWLNNGTRYLEGTELDLAEWVIDHESTFENAWLYGYTVEKPQLFYLKNKITGAYLYYDEATKLYSDIVGNVEDFFGIKTKFTQAEINNMDAGSYQQIEVEK